MFKLSIGNCLIATLIAVLVAIGCEDDTVSVKKPAPEPPALLTPRLWHPASPPISMNDETALPAANVVRAFWYQIEPDSGATMRDFNPELSKEIDVPVTTMHIEVDFVPDDPTRWTGIMAGFKGFPDPYGYLNGREPLDLSNATVMSIWVNDFKPDPQDRGGKIYIELGSIDEDFYRPDLNEHDREDRDGYGFTLGGDHNEDTGLDGIHTGYPGDDPYDDYWSTRIPSDGNRFTHVNGTEGNGREDSEDLDQNEQLDQLNAYFRYEVDLSATPVVDVRAEFPSYSDFKNSKDSWRLYKSSLADYHVVMPTGRVPYRDEIKYMRIWFDHIGEVLDRSSMRIQIREIEFE